MATNIDNRHIRVFISSTFNDMQAERDELVSKIFPILRKKAAERMSDPDIHVIILKKGLYNDTDDLGSAWHPNYKGQMKMAMSLIPYISTVTGWDMDPAKPVF